MRGPRARGAERRGRAEARGAPRSRYHGAVPGGSAPDSETTEGAPRTRRPRRGPPPASPSGAPLPPRPPPDSTSWTPCSRGPSARPPLPALPRAAPLPPAALCAAPRARGACGSFYFYFFVFFLFCLWKRGDRSVRFRPIYVSTREQASVACVRFPCWFFF